MMSKLFFGAALTCTCLAAIGCAGWKKQVEKRGVSEDREVRAAEAIRDFEQRRDSAQYQAALDRWRQGDAAQAETQLAGLVSRRPDLIEARLRLAEVQWARGEVRAEEHFRAVLASNEACAEAHHGLGLMLDAVGRREEARQHLERAAAIEPANELFQATLKTLDGPVTGVVSG